MRYSAKPVLALCGLLYAGFSFAHSPLFSCSKDKESISCEGGFTDGASAAGVDVRIVDMQDKVLAQGKLDAAGRYSFQPPAAEYHVVFDAGPNHQVSVYSGDIE